MKHVETIPQSKKCSVGSLLSTLTGKERDAFAYMLNAPLDEWSHADIHRSLQSEGYSSAFNQIGTHRRKQCGCFK